MQALTIEIATVPFLVEVPAGPLADVLGAAWQPFRCAPRGDALSIHFRCDGRPVPTGRRTMPAVVGATLVGEGFEATVSATHAEVVGALERFGVEAVVKRMLARALLARGGVVIHSVAVSVGGVAALLLGESGAGKSTLGQLGADSGLVRLADELVAVLDGHAHGTPWNIGVPAAAKLRLLATLGWAAAASLEPVPPADFLPLLLSNTLLPDDTPETRARVFQRVTRLLTEHPPHRFFFPPDARAAEFLRRHLGAPPGPASSSG